jgi:hypothetical protein
MMRRSLLSIILVAALIVVFLTGHIVSAESKDVFFSKSFTLPAESDQCYSADFPVTTMANTQIFGTIKSSGYVFFTIMTEQQFNSSQFSMSWGCRALRSTGILIAGAVTSYSLNWTSPSTGRYYFVLTNIESYDDSISVTLWTQ